jgi:hypothetical protein
MNLIYGVEPVMHRIRVKLYHNYFPKGEKYIARTDCEATLSVDQVCAAARDRGGFTGDFEDFVDHVKQYHIEASYQLLDGFAINTGYFSIHPNLGGTFKTVHEVPDHKTHPLTYRFRPLKPMRDMAASTHVVVEGLADVDGYIDEFLDSENNSINGVLEPGHQFMITGHRLKVIGDDPTCGLYFVPVGYDDPPVKVTRIIENTPTKIIGVIPEVGWAFSKLEIRTQYSGSKTAFLKNVRVITSDFTLEHV